MLPRIQRLRSRDDVLAVIRSGKSVRTPLVSIHIRPRVQREGFSGVRATVVVGKKVSSSAVRRHRVQRWLRELLRTRVVKNIQGPWDVVCVARPGIQAIISYKDLGQQLHDVMRQVVQLTATP